jgi:hypothetical protein
MRTMLRTFLLFFLSLVTFSITINISVAGISPINEKATSTMSFYLGQDHQLNPDIPTPESVLGFQVGEWHVRHDKLVEYMYALADASPRVKVEQIGSTYELRPLILLTVSSEQNLKQLNSIKAKHLELSKSVEPSTPNVTWMGYSVHGNEASGANASLLFAYYLAASQDQNIKDILDNQIIIIEPAINPDGLDRFANWVNSNRSINYLVSDPNNREHKETWPKGRTNHYWFDLNRDWLLLQHPESRARIAKFHEWKPQVLTDFHEMGAESSFFFQPGVPSRQNPLTPQENFDLTSLLGQHHAKQLDQHGQLYYSKESFDDFYYGKGSTYPDINGSIGILFEQATARGHLMATSIGDRHFRDAVKNQFLISLSTLEGVQANSEQLKTYQRAFYKQAFQDAKNSKTKAFIVSSKNKSIIKSFAEILLQHDIQVYKTNKDIKVEHQRFIAAESLVIPTRQAQYRLITTLFEQRKQFKNNTFYDVSTWHFPSAFDLRWARLDSGDYSTKLLGDALQYPVSSQGNFYADSEENQKSTKTIPSKPSTSNKVAYALNWADSNTARATFALLDAGFHLRALTKPTVLPDSNDPQRKQQIILNPGTILIPIGEQKKPLDQLSNLLTKLAKQHDIDVLTIDQGSALQGPDLGSNSIKPLVKPKPLLVIGEHISPYESGEVWHLLDQRLAIPLTMIQFDQLQKIALEQYTHIIMVDGKYKKMEEKLAEKFKYWLKQGGHLVLTKRAAKWIAEAELIKVDIVPPVTLSNDLRLNYSQIDKANSEHVIGGAIFTANIDPSHPIAFGVTNSQFSFFKTNHLALQQQENPFASIAQYTQAPLASGYASQDNQNRIAQTDAIIAKKHGKGSIILFADNPNFRGYWMGSQRLMINSLFFSHLFKNPITPK